MMISFTLRQLEYFLAVADTGSTVAASLAANVSQPAISKAIRDLEECWGETLFLRLHSRGLILTTAGERRAILARSLIKKASILNYTDGKITLNGQIKIGLLSTLSPLYAPYIIKKLQEHFPNCIISFTEGDIHALESGITQGQLDAAVLYDTPSTSKAKRLPVMELTPYLLLPDNHPLLKSAHTEISLHDVANEPYILMDLPHSVEYFLSIFYNNDIQPRITYRSGSIETVRSLVAHGLGYSILTTSPRAAQCYTGKVVVEIPLRNIRPQKLSLLLPDNEETGLLGLTIKNAILNNY
ncbi:MAG: LysR family transcriptional regulator [Acetobacter sp.]|uniref:LysR family transcriptional regulator n=1 Tax=Acetobacter sp. TaxID=440 RepID=UPI0039E9A918